MTSTLFAQLLTGLGLSGAAGLNAYVPLVVVAGLGRAGVVRLAAPFDVLTNDWVLGVLVVLLVVEFLVDKVPALDHANDVVQTFVRPTAGAVLFAGASGAISDVSPVLLVIAGLLTAFGVHATKAAARPVVNSATLGVGGPVVSVVEDVVSAIASLVAVFVPLLVLVLAALLGWGAFRLLRRLTSRRGGDPAPR